MAVDIKYFDTVSGAGLPDFPSSVPHITLVIINAHVDIDWQWAMSQRIGLSGCTLMSAWGKSCTSWDDSVDMVQVMAEIEGTLPSPDHHVSTTWHDNQTIEETFEFLASHMKYCDEPKPSQLYIVEIAPGFGEAKLREMYLSGVRRYDDMVAEFKKSKND